MGDWNANPADRGRWSPHWIATQAGLRIRSAGPGRHGDIDYPMADCAVYGVERHAPPAGISRSDHDVVTFDLRGPDAQALRLGTWNVEYGRPPDLVRGQVVHVLQQLDLDVLCLQEAADYHRVLGAIPGWRMVAFPNGGGHQVILVRYPIQLQRVRPVQLSPRGWKLVGRRGVHRELWATTLLADGWLWLANVHLPPSVNWRRGRIWGPPMRVAAYAAAASKLVRWERHR